MDNARVRRDLAVLSGELPHRGACTTHERTAAEYIRERFEANTPDVEIDDFHAIDTPLLVFASYYGEFIIIALVASWWPWIGFGYGVTVFLLYFVELSGHHVLSRLLPQFETQNVVARFLSGRPGKLVVISANYDSPRSTFIESAHAASWLSTAHLVLVVSMVAVNLSCVADANELFRDGFRFDLLVRWSAAGVLLTAAAALVIAELTGEHLPGSNDNASGVTVLLGIAEAFRERPLRQTEVWLVATGAKRGWLSGMRRLLNSHRFNRAETLFINVHAVGAGRLVYESGQGLLHTFRADSELLSIAGWAGQPLGVGAVAWKGLPTDGYLPLTRGFRCLGITALPEQTRGPSAAMPEVDSDVRAHPEGVLLAQALVLEILSQIDGGESQPPEVH
ncbi:MAG: hypothetical protein AMXMBFR84_44110 [Candidatus Hydrogenedentota bacterium]